MNETLSGRYTRVVSEYLSQHLAECCREYTEWETTAILKEDGKLRGLVKALGECGVSESNCLQLACSEVKGWAVKKVGSET